MKYMTGKAKMMMTGIALGMVAAGGMAALIAAGIQMRVKIEHDRAWMKGYRDGRENSLPPITVTTERMLIRYRENPGL